MNRNADDTGGSTQPRRRWLNTGPGLIIALVISGILGAQYIKGETGNRRQPSGSPIVERQIVASSYDEKSGPTPETGFIISRASKLHLSRSQVARLKRLEGKWREYYEPRISQARQAAARTREYLADQKGNPRTPVAQIQDAAAPVIALSGEISAARRDHWNKAVSILTAEQRRTLQNEREEAWTARTESR